MSASAIARRAAVFGATAILGLSLFGGSALGAPTEDTDTNDGGTPNNVLDAGDNRHPSGADRSVEHGGAGNQGMAASDPDDDGRGPARGNGGADKADGSGGDDGADQDGNNGCGNDDDFDDDNRGHCQRARSSATAGAPSPSPTGSRSPKAPASPSVPGSPGSAGSPGSPDGGSSAPSSPIPSSTGAVLSSTDGAAAPGDAVLAPANSVTVGHRAEVLGASLAGPPAARAKPGAARQPASSRRPGRATEVLGVSYTRGGAGASLARTGAPSTLLVMGFGGVALFALGLGLTRWAGRAGRPLPRAAR